MGLTGCRFLALLLAGLGLAPGAAHVLEFAPKMAWDAPLYAAVTSTLYYWFGSVGAAVQLGAVLAAALLGWRLRGRGAPARLALSGCAALVVSLLLWGTLVAPVNAEWSDAIRNAAPESVPQAYERLRARWEWGHVCAFAAWLAGYCLLLLSALPRETDRGYPA